MSKILVVNGPNLNLLGYREKNVYGDYSYDDFLEYIKKHFEELDLQMEFFQSNSEGKLIDALHDSIDKFDGIVINPGAYTHYSYAIYDAIKAIKIPTVEVHISNIYEREEFRQKSVTARACIGQISGFGVYSYVLGINAIVNHIKGR